MSIATVIVDGQTFTGRVYNIRDNGWPCVRTETGHIASGPEVIPERAQLELTVTKRGTKPDGAGWKLIHAWANPTDGALWLWQRAS